MTPNHHLARLARFPDVASGLQAIEGDRERDIEWWIEDHFQLGFQAGGQVLVPATYSGDIDDLSEGTLRTILAGFGVTAEQRLTIWWSSDGGMATLPFHLMSAYLFDIWYPTDDIFICSPPDDWALFLYHEGQFSAGHVAPSFMKLTSAEDCRQTRQWFPLDDLVPLADRQQELLTALTANRQGGLPPCSDLTIHTRGELTWLMQHEISSRPSDGADSGLKQRPDLRRAIMRNANLDDAFLAGCYLSEVDFSGANLTNAKFQFAELHGADFTGATLYRARCYRANFTHAVLRSACLNRAYLRKADLTGADFTGAHLQATQISANSIPQIMMTATDIGRLWIWTDNGR